MAHCVRVTPTLPRACALALLPAVLLAGCTTAPAEPEETFVPAPTAEEEQVTEHGPIEADAVLVVRATATDASGAQLSLQLQVHQSYPWDYAGTATLPAAIIEECGGSIDEDSVAAEKWSFTRANLTALATGDWSGVSVAVEPTAEFADVSGRGILETAPVAGATGCTTDKLFSRAGKGAIAIGLRGDAGALTGWASQQWGFRLEDGVLSDCSFEVTPLGSQFGGGTGWVESVDDGTCVIGPAAPSNARG